MQKLFSQFAKPTGVIGALVGSFMARENEQISRWTINFLGIEDHDHIVEIGFGSGYAMKELLLGTKQQLSITGFDPSETMVYQALRKLNKHITDQQQVQLFEQNADLFPNLQCRIDHVFAINNVTFWKNPVSTLKDIKRQMNPGGKIALTLRPHEKGSNDTTTELIGGQLKGLLTQAGFQQITIVIKPTQPNDTVCVLGINELV